MHDIVDHTYFTQPTWCYQVKIPYGPLALHTTLTKEEKIVSGLAATILIGGTAVALKKAISADRRKRLYEAWRKLKKK